MIPKPYAYRAKKEKSGFPRAALVLAVIALVSGLALSALYTMTKENIAAQQLAAKEASYREVCPTAQSFDAEVLQAKVDALDGQIYGGGAFGKAYINEAIVGKDSAGNDAGYVISATSGDGYKGNVTMSVGIAPDGTITGLAYTQINESPGLGMECDKPAFKDQFAGLSGSVALTKDGGGINQVSGATFSSRATTNAVSAALDFYAQNIAK
jgi:RnfABCDGE-type electron transport complex G subunit